MNNTDSALTNQWLIPIATNIIAAIIIVLAGWLAAKRRSIKGIIKAKVTTRFSVSAIPALIKYCVAVFVGIIPLGYNLYWLNNLLKPTTSPGRTETLAIVVAVISILYWAWNVWSQLRKYKIADFR
jgi:hypothetical protein